MSLDERFLLEALDGVLRSQAVRAQIDPIVERVTRKLASEPTAAMAWEPIPLSIYGDTLPAGIRSSWVFILRAGAISGAERHPNSHQRVMSYRATGDLQTGGTGKWQSNLLVSNPNATMERRWFSVPPNVWHQAVVGDRDWVVVSFHTVDAHELIEERPDAEDASRTHQRHYVTSERCSLAKSNFAENEGTVTLRPATERDFAFLRAFSTDPGDEKLRAQIRDGRLRIIETAGEPVGCIKFYILWEILPFIEVIMICEDRRRCGIGRDAVRSWEGEMAARSFRRTLTSTQADETAQEFWHRIGYRDCGSVTLPGKPAELFMFHDIGPS